MQSWWAETHHQLPRRLRDPPVGAVRPTFKIRQFQLRAAGVLFYRQTPSGVDFLLMRRGGYQSVTERYEDLGGKTDAKDLTITMTAAREVNEESNGILPRDVVLELVREAHWKRRYFINAPSKYVCYIVPWPVGVSDDLSRFGTRETGTLLQREMVWVPREQVKELNLHPRLSCPYFGPALNKAR